MNLEQITKFINEADEEIGKYRIEFILSQGKLKRDNYELPNLEWKSISYGEEEIDQVPDDKRGIYAFVLNHSSAVLPPHGYVLYIGIAGRKSDRSLRSRYRDYLNERKLLKRERIARMIVHWSEVLRFYYVPVEENVTSQTLENLEKQLNSALLPPLSQGDLEANTKSKRRAFK